MTDIAAGQVVTAADLNALGRVGLVVARLERATTQSIADNTDTAVDLTTSQLDLWSAHSTTTNPSRYQPNVAGWYKLSGGVSVTSVAGTVQLQSWVRMNGSQNIAGSHATDTTNSGSDPMSVAIKSTAVELNGSTDYVELMCRHESGASINTATTAARRPLLVVQYVGPPTS